MTKDFLSKSYCKKFGEKYAGYEGMTATDIARELYAHAILSVGSHKVDEVVGKITPIIGILNALVIKAACKEIAEHADVCDLGGDSEFRIKVFNAIWKVF